MPSAAEQLQTDFNPDTWDGWSFPTAAQRIAYASGVSYLHDQASLGDLNTKNDATAREAQITETTNSLTNAGVYVQVHFGNVGQPAEKWERLQFQVPVPVTDAVSGEQPPITAQYPRVTFPAEGKFNYKFLFHVGREAAEKHGFGTKFEEHVVRVHDGANKNSLPIPVDCPCDAEVREAIAQFHGGMTIPQGEYRLRMEVQRLPSVVVRLDGGPPLTAFLVHQGELKAELPVMDLFSRKLTTFSLFDEEPSTVRKSPLLRDIARGTKYIEIGTVLPVSEDDSGWSSIANVTLKTGKDTEETAALVYASLRRGESVEEVARNPNLGLVEVQISRVARVLSMNIHFVPQAIPSPNAGRSGNLRTLLGDFDGGAAKSFGAESSFAFRGRSASAAPVNIGRTELANPKVGPASPTMQVEWDGPVTAMRFCLSNAIT